MSINKFLQSSADGTTLRDYRHAARIFTDDNYRLSPKYGFLFYVEFDFNPLISNVSNTAAQELGMIVKSCSLPKFTVDTKVHNAYNRKNIVTNKINYDPVSIVFHDDQADNVRNFWYDYYSYFFRDSDYADVTYQGIHKYQSRPSFDWGYSPRPGPAYNNSQAYQYVQYIQGIRIYSLYQKNFSEYQLVNPVITSFSHGSHAQGGAETLEHSMSIQFETVKYLTGYTTPNTVGGYVDLHYDNTPSPLTPAEGTNLVDNGMGGYTRASDQIYDRAYDNYMTQASFSQSGLQGGGVQTASSGGFNLGQATMMSAFGGGNSGGFSIPNLGSLGSGIPSISMIGQQLQAGAVGIAGRLIGSAANGIIGGIASGLGSAFGVNGGALIGGLASIISNPAAALASAEGALAQYATQQASSFIQNNAQPYINDLSKNIGEGIAGAADYVSSAASDAYDSVAGEASALYYEATTDTSGYSDLF